MQTRDHRLRIYLPRGSGPRLWLPKGSRLHERMEQTHYLRDLHIWVTSTDLFPVLRSRLRSLRIEEFLALVSRVSWLRACRGKDFAEAVRDRGWVPEMSCRDYQMAFLVKVLLQDYDWNGPRKWSDSSGIVALAECTGMATRVLPSADRQLRAGGPQAAYGLLSRIGYQQFPDFEGINSYYRAMLLLRECARDSENQQGISLDYVLHEKIGLDIEEALFLAFGLYSLFFPCEREQVFGPNIMTDSPDFPGITRERVELLLNWLSTDYEGFRRTASHPMVASREGYEPYNLNPLVLYPIIRIPDGRCVIPIATYFLHRVTTGLFYDLIDTPHQSKVGNVIGRAIELYVRRLIADLPRHGAIIGETQYQPGKTTCEWIVDEPNGVVLIECKRGALRQQARTTGEREDIKKDIARENGVADGVAKLVESGQAIRAGAIPGVDRKKRIVGLLVTLDQFFYANNSFIRNIIEDVLDDKGVHLSDFKYQICPIPEFEDLCFLLTGTGRYLSDAIAEKLGHNEYAEWDFSQWVRKIHPEGTTARLPAWEAACDEHFNKMMDRFRRPASL